MKKTLLLLLIMVAHMTSCSQFEEDISYTEKSEIETRSATGHSYNPDYPEGIKEKTPYTVSTLREACQNFWDMKTHFDYPAHLIFDTTVGVTIMPLRPDQIEGNYYHTKFTYNNVYEYNTLMTFYDEIEFSDLPIDYVPENGVKAMNRIFYTNGEIIETEYEYYDESDEDFEEEYNITGDVWALVHKDQGFPPGIQYEIKDEWGFYPDYFWENSEPKNFLDWVFMEACYITGHENIFETAGETTKTFMGDDDIVADYWVPSGRIRVWDDYLEKYVPLVGVTVKLKTVGGRWSAPVYSNSSGNFNFLDIYLAVKGDIQLQFTFSGTHFSLKTEGLLSKGLGTAGFNQWVAEFDRPPFDIDSNNGRLWGVCQVFRGAEGFFNQDVITKGFTFNKPSSSNRVNIIYRHTHNSDALGKFISGKNKVKIWMHSASGGYLATVFHEFGHWMHYQQYHQGFVAYNNHLDANVKESWANFTEWLMLQREYERWGKPVFVNTDKFYYSYNSGGSSMLVYHWLYDQTKTISGFEDLQEAWDKTRSTTSNGKKYTPFFIDLYDNYNQSWSRKIRNLGDEDQFPEDYIWLPDISAIQRLANRNSSLKGIKQSLKDNHIGNGVPDLNALNLYFSFYGL